jgi:hypothetical protein
MEHDNREKEIMSSSLSHLQMLQLIHHSNFSRNGASDLFAGHIT